MKYLYCTVAVFIFMLSGNTYANETERLHSRASRIFVPLEKTMPGSENDTAERIELGRKLFFDKRLSINNTQSCASCHRLENGIAGVDNLATSPGARGETGTRNSPTVLNAGWQDSLFWDGRAENLIEQAKGPILNPIEMGMPDEQAVVKKISAIVEYQQAFPSVFSDEKPAVSYQNIAIAIAAFERTLITPGRFDDFLQGDLKALDEAELRGLESFISIDCVSCHDGMLVGGELMEVLGKEHDYENQSDLGLYLITKQEEDKMFFKVSPLRNVALTAPYFHDGKIKTLEEAVSKMAKLQLDEDLTKSQVDDIVSFLKTLSDKNR